MIQDILREIKRQSLHVYQVAVYTEQGLETAQVQDAGQLPADLFDNQSAW